MAAYAIQFRRGTTTEHNSFTGLLGEVTVDTTKKTVVVHDGSTAGGYALALEGAAVSTTTGTYSSNVTVGGTLGVTGLTTMSGGGAMTGDLTMTGHILPSANITYDLGSATKMWKDIYVGPGSLYVNGKKVIEDDSGAINITTDADEDLKITTSGTGTLKLISANGVNITGELGATSGDLQVGDHIDMNSSLIKELATPVSGTDATNKNYVDSAADSAVTDGSNAGSFTTVTTSGNATVGGNLTVNGTTTSVNTTNVTFEDNMFVLNSNTVGTPTENSGFEVERGDSLNVQFLWNETDDRWTTGSNAFHSGAIATPMMTGDVTGDVTGDLTGDVTGDVTGNASGSAGTVTSIAAHIKDEDNMASDSATHVASQQSVKAYVDAATPSSSDVVPEGASNLYFTDARARGAISVSGDISYNSGTGVISTTGLASSDTDDLAEGSTNLYYTDARADARTAISTATNTTAWEAYADQAEVDAKAYADTAESDAVASAESKDVARANTAVSNIATAKSEAIASASTDATTKADAAEAAAIASAESKDAVRATAANSYTDAAIAALADSAPGTLDTLNELAAALGDDASFSTTVTNSIATKLPLAGGTMSGDIAMGGNDITGGGDATFTNFNGTATYAKYADLAERYAADATYEEGTVMVFGGEAEVTSAQGYGSTAIAGVVSTKPAFAMNSEAGSSETHPYIALQGRVPCKVTGTVSKGDILVASEVSGTATKWLESSVDPRMTAYVGIAIEDKTTDGEGYVEVKVGK